MKKKLLGLLLMSTFITGLIAGCGTTNKVNTNKEPNKQASVQGEDSQTTENADTSETSIDNATSDEAGKVLVVYYSAQGHTKPFAEALASETGADIFEIVPEDEYTDEDLDWTDEDSRVSKEHDNKSLRDVELTTTTVENWDSYDTVYIGYPIWWGIAAWPVDTFVKANDFIGKTIIPFCTSTSSGMGESGELLEELAGTGDWKEGMRFQQSESTDAVKKLVKEAE